MTAASVTASRSNRTVYTADWVLPITTAAIRNGAVAVVGSDIAFVGPSAALPEQFADFSRVDLARAVVMPGLINAHTHLELTAMRGFLEGLAFSKWLTVLTHARRDCYDAQSLYDSACAGIEEALRNGITTCADTTESGETLRALRDMGLRGIGYLEVFGPDHSQCDGAITTLQRRANALRQHDTSLVQTGISPHAPYTVSASLFRAVAQLARSESWKVAVHVAESHAETQFVRDGTGPFATGLIRRGIPVAPQARSPIQLLEDTGLLPCQPLLIHAIQIDPDDIARIAERGATVVHCPISNAKLGHGIQPLHALQQAAVAIGLGTDSVASNDRMDLLGEARQATLLQSIVRREPDVLSATEALAMATIGGARALGLEHVTGSLEVGKAADLAAFSLDHPDARPVHDPGVTLVHVLAGAAPALLTVVAGRERVRRGQVIDAAPDRAVRMEQLGDRLNAWRNANVRDTTEN